MKYWIITLHFFILSLTTLYAQDNSDIKRRIIGTFHSSNAIINGFSFGFLSTLADDRNVKTNGL